ncbi:MAG TPA: protease pro-enzyme activation domain-containing protein [Terracidiphilus sp.]|nr:protease pro-enzyme activation domain-containing protein [Terracidiphilus sp.]
MALLAVLPLASLISRHHRKKIAPLLIAALLALAGCAFTVAAQAQNVDRVPQSFDPAPTVVLAGHHPLWASAANDLGPLNPNQTIDNLTMVLARSPEQEKAFDQFLEDQQNPGSPNYHHWLTAPEIGQRFGLTDHDIAAISSWLTSQGLHIRFVTPDKALIAFGGSAANIGRAFGTEMHAYKVHGESRISVDSDPKLPSALVPVVLAVRGFFTIQEKPQHVSRNKFLNSPDITINTGSNYAIGPADFATIYDLPATLSGAGVKIGIVSESHTDFADFEEYSSFLGVPLNNPTEIVPSQAPYDAVDPGPAYTSEPACAQTNPNTCSDSENEQLSLQSEATLDVTRAGTIATGATIELVIAEYEQSGPSEGVLTDAEYLAETTPAPAQIMSISFGSCESEAGSEGVDVWNSLFQTAAAAGYSIFVSSGDSDAAGCDDSFNPPPKNPAAISPNSICSPQYETCVGGTEFADASDYSTYWSSTNGAGYESARGYIPEGAWNDPGNATNGFEVAGSGGGVSTIVPTPTWQTGTGVPSARSGRYTPDVAFSSSLHDGYFGCLASSGGSCVPNSQNEIPFIEWGGTSAAAPDMAGITALLDQKLGTAQGNIAPGIYTLAAGDPSAFHDVTEASSGVSSCSLSTASMCNNSAPSATSATGGEAGYLVHAGFDEVTGWGSLDVSTFITNFAGQTITPTVTVTPSASTITVSESLSVGVTVSGGSSNPTPTGSVILSGGGYSSSTVTLASGAANFTIPANSLTQGSDTLTVAYTPDSNSSSTYADASGAATVTVDALQSPTITVTPKPSSITTAQPLTVQVTVAATSGLPTPTGSIQLSGGGYSSTATLASGTANFTVPGSTFTQGIVTLTGSYTPDSNSSNIYLANSNTASLTVAPLQTPTVTVTPSSAKVTIDEAFTVAVTVAGQSGFSTPTGSVVLTSGSFTSPSATLSSGSATFNFAAGSLPAGTDTLSVAYTPDSASSVIYTGKAGTGSVTVDPLQTPTVTVTPAASLITQAEQLSVMVTVAGTTGFGTPTGTVKLTGGGYTSASATLSSGAATINIPANSLSIAADTLTATYTPDTTGATIYTSIAGTGSVMVDAMQIPTITVTPGATSINASQSLMVNISAAGTTGFGTPTGTVTLTSGTYASSATALSGGSAQITVPAGALTVAADTLSATYTPDSTSSPIYENGSGTATVTVTAPPGLAAGTGGTTTLSVSPGATTGNTGTIVVAGTNGFTGTVSLTCAVTTSMTGVNDPPTCSLNPASVSITGATAVSSTLTVNTTAPTTSANEKPSFFWPSTGGTALALVLFFFAPGRRRNWLAMVALLILGAATGITACGGGGGGGGNSNPGTTAGSYTITVAGTATGVSATTVGTIALTVQ